jgi:hypothetical protein
MRQDICMSPVDDTDPSSPHPDPEDVQELLAAAHAGLLLSPERSDGSKVVVVATIGTFDLRLVELTRSADGIPPLWIELCDTRSRRIVDSIGRKTLQDLATVTGRLIARAKGIGGTTWFDRSP